MLIYIVLYIYIYIIDIIHDIDVCKAGLSFDAALSEGAAADGDRHLPDDDAVDGGDGADGRPVDSNPALLLPPVVRARVVHRVVHPVRPEDHLEVPREGRQQRRQQRGMIRGRLSSTCVRVCVGGMLFNLPASRSALPAARRSACAPARSF